MKVFTQLLDPMFTGGPPIWKASLKWDADEVIDSFGETLSLALTRLAAHVAARERQDAVLREDARIAAALAKLRGMAS